MMTWMFDWPGIGREEKDLGPITVLSLFALALPCPCPHLCCHPQVVSQRVTSIWTKNGQGALGEVEKNRNLSPLCLIKSLFFY